MERLWGVAACVLVASCGVVAEPPDGGGMDEGGAAGGPAETSGGSGGTFASGGSIGTGGEPHLGGLGGMAGSDSGPPLVSWPPPEEALAGTLAELLQQECVIEFDELGDGSIEKRWGIAYQNGKVLRQLAWDQPSKTVTV